ncbi:RidA family protein [Acidovorax sp. sic0104]|uniref:RidA family protein n=1 Tax=Acidovorax sp. sic0104 TaxID=2854784 RepID=UPI001C45EEFC|nr:RidA family protein [Acidovorax sp. sic0104]MBV7543059.1 RidA family protein [Acidovorax sp. sic0104]
MSLTEKSRSSDESQRYGRLRQYGFAVEGIRPNGVYQPALAVGSMVYSAGQVSRNGSSVLRANSSRTNGLEEMKEAARLAAARAVAAISGVVDLDDINQIVSVTGYIACSIDFVGHSAVMDSASELLLAIFGPAAGRHVRTAVGVVSLPAGGLVEVQITANLSPRA